jgi:hypothetical protein
VNYPTKDPTKRPPLFDLGSGGSDLTRGRRKGREKRPAPVGGLDRADCVAVVRGAEAELANQDLDTGKCRSYSDVYRRLAMRSGADG